jgi:tetratricopeptide (TPR) repeat protein
MPSEAKKLKKGFLIFLLLFVGFFFFLLSPLGLNVVVNQTRGSLESGWKRLLFVKANEALCVYGKRQEAFENYKVLYEKLNPETDTEDVKYALLRLAKLQYELKEYQTALKLYEVWKARWPQDQEQIVTIDKRRQLILGTIDASSRGAEPPEWVQELHQKYVSE